MTDPLSDETDYLAPEFDAKSPDAGRRVLDDVQAFIEQFCVFPNEHCAPVVALWAAHAHMIEHFHTTPRLALLSPELSSGKTRVLEVLHPLTPESEFALSASAAVIFRMLDKKPITLLFDEVDTIFGRRGKDDPNEDLRALLNAGYKRGATVPRCVGPKHEVHRFPVFCPTALAGLGDLPETIMSRSVVIRMRRRAGDERVNPFRTRTHEPVGNELRDMLATWAEQVGREVGAAWPKLPDGVVDRNAEIWEPLISVADAAGGDWPSVARRACDAFCGANSVKATSLGVRLLKDLRTIFGDAKKLTTAEIINRLTKPEDYEEEFELDADAPWAEFKGNPITPRAIANILKKYEVAPTKVKIDGRPLQGYRKEDLWDSWRRYLPPPPKDAEPAEPSEPELSESGGAEVVSLVPQVPEVPDTTGTEGFPCPNCDGEGCDWCAS